MVCASSEVPSEGEEGLNVLNVNPSGLGLLLGVGLSRGDFLRKWVYGVWEGTSAHEGRKGQEKIGEGEISEKRNNFSLLTCGDDK